MTLRLRDVHARLSGRLVLDGLTFEAPAGAITVLVGPNGAGKSSALRAAAGLLRPETGRITWQDTDLRALDARARARIIGLVPQAAHLDHPFTVQEVVHMGRYAHTGPLGSKDPEGAALVQAALTACGLETLAARPVDELSGGEVQRVLVARTLAQGPQVLLLDEPTANLDLGQAAAVLHAVRAKAASGRAVIMVVHDLALASRVADHIVLMQDGRALAAGPPREVLTAEQITRAFRTPVAVQWDADGLQVRVRA